MRIKQNILELESLNKENLPDLTMRIEKNGKKIKALRAVTYIFDVVIIMAALLYAFDVDFSKWLLFPAAGSVLMHTRLSVLYEKKCILKQQESILKYLK